ncbi:MAG: hypothetical protein FGF50_09260 [Candidatus Brockarchaeota archaeon]|nr:hypothetical protein [Candidatus Brockarchaeota archaeon]
MLVRRWAASEVLGAILVAVITMVMCAVYIAYGLVQTQTQTASISDMLRLNAKAQRQLLSLSYYYSDGKLHIFIYNMGNEESTLKTVVIGSVKYDLPNPHIRMKDAVTQNPIDNCKIAAKQLVEITAPRQQGQVDLLVLTEEGGVFIWRLNL